MSNTMSAVIKAQPGPGLSLNEVPVPRPGPTDLLVRVKRAAICGSDIQCYLWTSWAEKGFSSLPQILGHEFSGEIIETGELVKHFKPGDRVAGETHIPCGECYQCLTGEQHICQHLNLFGHTVDGCFAEYCTIPERAARRIPDEMSYDDAALLEPLGIAVRPCVDGGSVTGQSAVVLGCGAIGLMAIGALRASAAYPIIAIDPIAARRELASTMGADHAINPADGDVKATVIEITHGDGAGVLVEASGAIPAIEGSFDYLRKGGCYFAIGMTKKPANLDVAQAFIYKEIKLFGLHGRRMFSSWHVAEALLLGKKIKLEPIVGKRLPLAEFEEAFELTSQGKVCKVLFEISD